MDTKSIRQLRSDAAVIDATTKKIDGITFEIKWSPECSWRSGGYMVSVVGGPQSLLVRTVADESFRAGAAYVAENYEQVPGGQGSPGMGNWRARHKV